MSIKTWYTAEDIYNDIPMISGRRRRGRGPPVGNIGQGYMVIGNAPPPVRPEAEDDEMREMFGSVVHEQGTIHTEHSPPDLQGITNLLRMVQGSDDDCDSEDVSNITQPSCVVAISKPTRLNPNVEEFKPKGALSSHNSSSDVNTDKAKEAETNTTKPLDDKSTENENNIKQKIDEDFATKLKNEITDTTKSDSFEAKKRKNVAIATLLRMYAANNNNDVVKKALEKPQVKLITPDYFENRSSPVTPVKDFENETVQEPLLRASTGTPTTSNSTTDSKGVIPSSTPSYSSMPSEVKSEPALPTEESVSVAKAAIVDPAVKKSIEKVNQWFGEPVQKKSPTIYIGPIAYKKKEPIAAKSLSTVSTDKKAQEPVQGQYKPSDYATDLGKKYEQRNMNKKKNKNRNMWSDLDIILKERDEELAQKRCQQASSSSDFETPQ